MNKTFQESLFRSKKWKISLEMEVLFAIDISGRLLPSTKCKGFLVKWKYCLPQTFQELRDSYWMRGTFLFNIVSPVFSQCITKIQLRTRNKWQHDSMFDNEGGYPHSSQIGFIHFLNTSKRNKLSPSQHYEYSGKWSSPNIEVSRTLFKRSSFLWKNAFDFRRIIDLLS